MSELNLSIQSSVQTSIQAQLQKYVYKYSGHLSIFYKILITTLLASFTTKIFNQSDVLFNKFFYMYKYVFKLIFYTKINKISLISKKIWTKYGRYRNMISEEKLGILHYISKNLTRFKDLYELTQDCRSNKHNVYSGEESDKLDSYYTISQTIPVEIFNEKDKYITVEMIEDITNNECSNNDKMEKIITDNLTLNSNLSLQELKMFIKKAADERKKDVNDDTNRYIYTYLGEDDDKNPIFEQEIFKPYCNFDKLVGNIPKKIEHEFNFFSSEKGQEWYAKRNLPYQMTVLLYGIPGTGKSCIASAVANKFNLHIVRIKLSLIKTNFQFIKAFKNKTFCEKNIDYKNILYLFDELDTEQNSILKNRKNRTDSISSNVVTLEKDNVNKDEKKKELINKYSIKEDDLNNLLDSLYSGPKRTEHDSLTLGTILEELNGINQMYGRKMFIISNHPEHLDPAILRPGRIDLKYELSYLTYCEILELINMFFPNSDYTQYEKDTLQTTQITAAKLTNLCKISKTKDNVMTHIYQ